MQDVTQPSVRADSMTEVILAKGHVHHEDGVPTLGKSNLWDLGREHMKFVVTRHELQLTRGRDEISILLFCDQPDTRRVQPEIYCRGIWAIRPEGDVWSALGSWAEYALTGHSTTFKIPDDMSYAKATTLVNYQSPYFGPVERGAARAGTDAHE